MAQQVAQYVRRKGDKIARQFYDRFKKVHTVFVEFIQGMEVKADREWYATLMLSRLMFCYFIQKSNFLDNNKNYLRDRLELAREKKKANKYYSFYKHILIPLFREALGAPHNKGKLAGEIGNIPLLDGGLFEAHTLEKKYPHIEIDDHAFAILFDLFDQYTWRLDNHTESKKDIDPDIVGYIFEKYINDRAQMGAYYTKENITDYISKNCIIPWLFKETKLKYRKAFLPRAAIWKMVRESGSRYIYHSLEKGVSKKLPDEIATGISAINNRNMWGQPAPDEFALPDESWREVVDRRNRYAALRSKIENGSIRRIEDFITYNLNIRQFARDVLSQTTDPELLHAFYGALQRITILDPTCGSGAFLLAAMNILEELYEDCLERMKYFAQAAPTANRVFFRKTIADVFAPQHPNLKYFIYKNIILRNLYGVDIMPDAVEITRLRLLLKMMSTVSADYPQQHAALELLPDTEFNIRAGNALIGLVTQKELGQLSAANLIQKKCVAWARELDRYKEMQLSLSAGYEKLKAAKEALYSGQKEWQTRLNKLLYKQSTATTYEHWLSNYQPFHWYAECFPVIGKNGGFDVIIGNPPYVEYSKVKHRYTISGYETGSCRNLYPYVVERCKQLLRVNGTTGFILPLSAFCTQRMQPLVQLYRRHKGHTWISHFGWRPATLFEGVNIPLSVAICSGDKWRGGSNLYVTEYYKWYQEKREHIMTLVEYNEGAKLLLHDFVFPKIGPAFNSIFEKLLAVPSNIRKYIKETPHRIYYRDTGGLYWRIVLDFEPAFIVNGDAGSSSTLAFFSVENEEQVKIFTALLNSNLFWLYYVAYSSFHHVNPVDLLSFPVCVEDMDEAIRQELISLSDELMADMKKHSVLQTRNHKGGDNSQSQTFYPSLSKPIVDKIDEVIARYYHFTPEELDRIIHYDLKFRLQREKND